VGSGCMHCMALVHNDVQSIKRRSSIHATMGVQQLLLSGCPPSWCNMHWAGSFKVARQVLFCLLVSKYKIIVMCALQLQLRLQLQPAGCVDHQSVVARHFKSVSYLLFCQRICLRTVGGMAMVLSADSCTCATCSGTA
jgi:hypothetical protein